MLRSKREQNSHIVLTKERRENFLLIYWVRLYAPDCIFKFKEISINSIASFKDAIEKTQRYLDSLNNSIFSMNLSHVAKYIETEDGLSVYGEGEQP